MQEHCSKECGLGAIVAFSVQLSWVLSAYNYLGNNTSIITEIGRTCTV